MESQLFFFSKCGGILATLSGNFWYPPELEPRALTPMEVFSAIATFSKKKKEMGKSPWSSASVAAWAQPGTRDLGHVQQRCAGLRGAENNLSLEGDRVLSAAPSPWLCS